MMSRACGATLTQVAVFQQVESASNALCKQYKAPTSKKEKVQKHTSKSFEQNRQSGKSSGTRSTKGPPADQKKGGSHKRGDDMKEALRTDGNSAVCRLGRLLRTSFGSYANLLHPWCFQPKQRYSVTCIPKSGRKNKSFPLHIRASRRMSGRGDEKRSSVMTMP